MKLGEFKVTATLNNGCILLAYKNDGLLFTVKDTVKAERDHGFTFHLGKEFTQVTYIDDKHLELVQPRLDEKVKLLIVDKDKFKKFLLTDYNNHYLKEKW